MIYGPESVTQSFDNRVCIEIKVTKRLSCHLYWPEKLKIEWCEVWCGVFADILSPFWTFTLYSLHLSNLFEPKQKTFNFFISYKVKIQNRPEHAVHLYLVYVNAHLSAIPAV